MLARWVVWVLVVLAAAPVTWASTPSGARGSQPVRHAIIAGGGVSWSAPANPWGTLILFHGADMDGARWFEIPQARKFIDEANARGLVVVAPDSVDRVRGMWSTRLMLRNKDIDRVRAVLWALVKRGVLPDDGPRFGLGMSNGGAFVSLFGPCVGLDAVAVFHAAGNSQALRRADLPPLLYVTGENDSVVDIHRIMDHVGIIEARGLSVATHLVRQTPARALYDAMSQAQRREASAVLDQLREAGFVSRQGYVNTDLPPGAFARLLEPELVASLVHGDDVRLTLRASSASHAFRADAGSLALDWFEVRAPSAP